jgi:hypothetical protein
LEDPAVHVDVEFNLVPRIDPSDIESCMLDHENGDEILHGHVVENRVPSLSEVFRFVTFLYQGSTFYSPECNIMALVYINRLTVAGKLPMSFDNWRSIWLVVIMIAQKVWDDRPIRTSGFARLLNVNSKDLRNLEFKTLTMLQFVTGVRPSLYARYYFELRQLYADIVGPLTTPAWAPLSAFTKSKLRAKNEKCEEIRQKMTTAPNADCKDSL